LIFTKTNWFSSQFQSMPRDRALKEKGGRFFPLT
jgi:hypothetical protein